MSYYTTYAVVDLKADFRGIRIAQLRFGTEPNGREQILCFEVDPDFNKMISLLKLNVEDLPVLNIQFYKKEYLKNYYPEVVEDVPVEDMPEMEFDTDAKRHIVTKALSVIPFKEVFSDGSCNMWTDWLGGEDTKYGDFGTMFFAKDAKAHLNPNSGIEKQYQDAWIEIATKFAEEHSEHQAVVFGGIY